MIDRPLVSDSPRIAPAPGPDLIFRTPPNWPAVCLFAVLSLLHLTNCTLSFLHQRIEGYMSLIFACIFALIAWVAWRAHFELAVLPGQRRLRLRTGFGRFISQRYIPFSRVHGVRLTTTSAPDNPRCQIELLCDLEDIECPPTPIPRQEALCLAMTLGVRLIKVSPDGVEYPSLEPDEFGESGNIPRDRFNK